jgi:hypothetical protein
MPPPDSWLLLPSISPFPVNDLRFVDAVFVSISAACKLFVSEAVLCVRSFNLEFRHSINHVDRDTESVGLISNGQLERRIDIPLFLVSAHVEIVMVMPSIGQFVDRPGVRMEIENDRPVHSE